MEVFSSSDAFRLAPHGSLVRFDFPLSPLFLRWALATCSITLAWCRSLVASLVLSGPGVWRLASFFGAGPLQRGLFPRPGRRVAVGALAMWGSPFLPLSLFVSLAGAFRRAQLSNCLSLSGSLCSETPLFLSLQVLAGMLSRLHHIAQSGPGGNGCLAWAVT